MATLRTHTSAQGLSDLHPRANLGDVRPSAAYAICRRPVADGAYGLQKEQLDVETLTALFNGRVLPPPGAIFARLSEPFRDLDLKNLMSAEARAAGRAKRPARKKEECEAKAARQQRAGAWRF